MKNKTISLQIKPLVWKYQEIRVITSDFLGLKFAIIISFDSDALLEFILTINNREIDNMPKTFNSLTEAKEYAEKLKEKMLTEQLVN
jgi:hypothetical protein